MHDDCKRSVLLSSCTHTVRLLLLSQEHTGDEMLPSTGGIVLHSTSISVRTISDPLLEGHVDIFVRRRAQDSDMKKSVGQDPCFNQG